MTLGTLYFSSCRLTWTADKAAAYPFDSHQTHVDVPYHSCCKTIPLFLKCLHLALLDGLDDGVLWYVVLIRLWACVSDIVSCTYKSFQITEFQCGLYDFSFTLYKGPSLGYILCGCYPSHNPSFTFLVFTLPLAVLILYNRFRTLNQGPIFFYTILVAVWKTSQCNILKDHNRHNYYFVFFVWTA